MYEACEPSAVEASGEASGWHQWLQKTENQDRKAHDIIVDSSSTGHSPPKFNIQMSN